jgi:diguanylate cyclase (GGDEF)-like protein
LKTSQNIWEILLYHKVALAESKSRNYNLKKETLTDPLTKLYNRRLVDTKLDELIYDFNRTWNKFSIFIIDIDFFKKINDTFWHDMWDEVLKWISTLLKANLRNTDIAARWWWEEFMIILKWINHKLAIQKAESIRKRIEETLIHSIMNNSNLNKFCLNDKWCKLRKECQQKNLMCFPRKITCSIWVSTINKKDWKTESKSHLIKRADSALYIAKENWRNMVYSGKSVEVPKKED